MTASSCIFRFRNLEIICFTNDSVVIIIAVLKEFILLNALKNLMYIYAWANGRRILKCGSSIPNEAGMGELG